MVKVKMSRANRQVSAKESSSSADTRVVLVVVRKTCRCSSPTWNGARKLDPPKSRATSIVWCGAAPSGGACPSCVAVHQWRLGHDDSDLPSEQQTRWDQMLQSEPRTVRSFGPRQPCSVTQQHRWQRPRNRSGGRRKPYDQAGAREHWLSKMKWRGRLGASLGRGEREREQVRRCARRGAGPMAEIGTTGSGGASTKVWTTCATATSKVAREDS